MTAIVIMIGEAIAVISVMATAALLARWSVISASVADRWLDVVAAVGATAVIATGVAGMTGAPTPTHPRPPVSCSAPPSHHTPR